MRHSDNMCSLQIVETKNKLSFQVQFVILGVQITRPMSAILSHAFLLKCIFKNMPFFNVKQKLFPLIVAWNGLDNFTSMSGFGARQFLREFTLISIERLMMTPNHYFPMCDFIFSIHYVFTCTLLNKSPLTKWN